MDFDGERGGACDEPGEPFLGSTHGGRVGKKSSSEKKGGKTIIQDMAEIRRRNKRKRAAVVNTERSGMGLTEEGSRGGRLTRVWTGSGAAQTLKNLPRKRGRRGGKGKSIWEKRARGGE